MQVSKATARRATLQTGEAQLAVCEGRWSVSSRRHPKRLWSGQASDEWGWSDGAPGRGRVGRSQDAGAGRGHRKKRGEVCTQHLSYFSRLCDAERFAEAAWSKRIGGGWNGQQRCVRCKMERSGCKGWSTTTVQMRCASWILPMPPNTSMRSGRPCRQQEADCPPPGWRECCTGSNTRDPSGCSSTWPGWPRAIPVPPSRRNWPICRSARRTCSTPPIRQQAGPLARGASKVPTRWSSKHG